MTVNSDLLLAFLETGEKKTLTNFIGEIMMQTKMLQFMTRLVEYTT